MHRILYSLANNLLFLVKDSLLKPLICLKRTLEIIALLLLSALYASKYLSYIIYYLIFINYILNLQLSEDF